MNFKGLLFFLILISNFALGQTFPDSQNPNRIENQVIDNKQKKLLEEKRLKRIIRNDFEFGVQLITKEKERRKILQNKLNEINDFLTQLREEVAQAKKNSKKGDKKVRKIYKSIIKTTKKIDKQKRKFYVLNERIKLIEQILKEIKSSTK